MTRKLYTTPVDRYFSIKSKHGLKKEVTYLMFRWSLTMTEVCELIGIFLLNLLGRQYDTKIIGLYRDDGLSIFGNCSGPQVGKIKKQQQNLFKNNGFDVIIKRNMKIVN